MLEYYKPWAEDICSNFKDSFDIELILKKKKELVYQNNLHSELKKQIETNKNN